METLQMVAGAFKCLTSDRMGAGNALGVNVGLQSELH